ncbi:MAG: hypothetical protein ACRDT6_04100 [Micromonosporaceae bacterium]
MTALSSAQCAAYARERIRTADVILACHTPHAEMCSCGRVLPCPVASTLTTRRAHFVAVLGCLVAAPVVGRAAVRLPRWRNPSINTCAGVPEGALPGRQRPSVLGATWCGAGSRR